MSSPSTAGVISLLALLGLPALCQTEPAPNGWDAKAFGYVPATLVVEESTPKAVQLDFMNRPPAVKWEAPTDHGVAKPATLANMDIVHLRFRDLAGEDVPALLCKPSGKVGPFPLVIALHGINSHKAQVCGQIAPALTRRGFAVLAFDLPLHGERPGNPRQILDFSNLPRTISLCRQAVVDLRQCIDVADARNDLDTRHGVILAGYSLGAMIDSVAGPTDDRVNAMLLMVAGTPEFPAAFSVMPGMAALQPQRAIPHFAGRPLLMLNGSGDTTVTPDMGRRLFAAAAEPKEQRWYDSGHRLPTRAYEDGANWIARTWKQLDGKATIATDTPKR